LFYGNIEVELFMRCIDISVKLPLDTEWTFRQVVGFVEASLRVARFTTCHEKLAYQHHVKDKAAGFFMWLEGFSLLEESVKYSPVHVLKHLLLSSKSPLTPPLPTLFSTLAHQITFLFAKIFNYHQNSASV
jgi:hypothetical protein